MARKGCIKFYRWEYNRLMKLSNLEYRLYMFYRQIVPWDLKNKHFGSTSISLSAIRLGYFSDIPGCSITMLQEARIGLIEKKFLRADENDFTHVDNMRIFQLRVPVAEQMFRLIEKGVQPTEEYIRRAEGLPIKEVRQMCQELAQKFSISSTPVPPAEHLVG